MITEQKAGAGLELGGPRQPRRGSPCGRDPTSEERQFMDTSRPLQRRQFLRIALTAAALTPVAGGLASCAAGGGQPAASSGPTGAVSADKPFGVPDGSTVDAVISNGAYGVDYGKFAANKLKAVPPTVTPKLSPSTQIAQKLHPRSAGGTPPDLIDNSGANAIG